MRREANFISRILKATANDDYTLLLEFENGNKIIFNMCHLSHAILQS